MPFPSDALRITVLGSGTSMGVPTIGCHCDVCSSTDPRDNRLRPSILVRYDGHCVVIDTTPDFRTQALRAKINRLDAILFTHEHADHIMGLDDVRPFEFCFMKFHGSLQLSKVDNKILTFFRANKPTWAKFGNISLCLKSMGCG